jgi:hypothetical protein
MIDDLDRKGLLLHNRRTTYMNDALISTRSQGVEFTLQLAEKITTAIASTGCTVKRQRTTDNGSNIKVESFLDPLPVLKVPE